jgi:hypothetical protein
MADGVLMLLGLFAVSFGIGVVAPLAGVGGGVLYTPLLLGFTNINPDIVRGAGLTVATYSSIMASTRLFRQRIAPFRLVILASAVLMPSGVLGAQMGIYVTSLGKWAIGLLRVALGVVMFLVVAVLLLKRVDWPEGTCDGRAVRIFNLAYSYHDQVLGKAVNYCPARLGFGLLIQALVGFAAGFFGLGAGWALIPVYNLVMLLPLRVAVAAANASIGIANSAALWVFLHSNKLNPEIYIVSGLAVILGSLLGARLLATAPVRLIRSIVIVIMALNGVQLVIKGGLEMAGL